MRVLLVEDEVLLAQAVREHVVADGHAVDWVERTDAARAALDTVDYDLVLLDLHLPDGSGLAVLAQLRAAGRAVPVLILTARDQLRDRIDGLNAGADDYLVKPFDLDELSARIGAVARRYDGDPSPTQEVGDLIIDRAGHRVWRGPKQLQLTRREWALLERLARRPGAVVSKTQLEDALYAFGEEIESNVVEAHVSRLRKKLGPGLLDTVRGLGYRLQASP